MAAIGSKINIGQIAQSVANAVNDKKKQPPGGRTAEKDKGKWGGSSDGGTSFEATAPTQGTTYKAPGMDDLGQVDYSKQWDSTLSGGGASYDEMEKIYKDRQDKINSGDPYGQFAGDAKSKEMEAWLQANKPKTPSGGGSDYSGYIEDMYAAKQKAALDALRNAYEKNVLGLDRAQAAIAPQYQSARNEAAGQAELQKKNFAEYAAANGLNSGAGGQAQLSFANALQSNLSGIAQKEASTMADLELQRSQMETDYNNAIAQAESQGNYELAQQLYAEMVRQDEAMRAQMQWQAQQDLQKDQLAWNKEQADIANGQWDKSFAADSAQNERVWAERQAQEMAQYGNFDGYKALGYSDSEIQSIKDYWSWMQQQSTAKANTGGGGDPERPTLTYAQTMDAIDRGSRDPNVLSAYKYYMGAEYSEPSAPSNPGGYDSVKSAIDSLLYGYGGRGEDNQMLAQRAFDLIKKRISAGVITSADGDRLGDYIASLMKG